MRRGQVYRDESQGPELINFWMVTEHSPEDDTWQVISLDGAAMEAEISTSEFERQIASGELILMGKRDAWKAASGWCLRWQER